VGIDLPDASVLIQISGTFGSRQEEAQRLGRILRPSAAASAHFYTLVEAGTREVGDAERRQRFLVNQGYDYEVVDAASIERPPRR
jgi:DNA excision repair protein ERCC-3